MENKRRWFPDEVFAAENRQREMRFPLGLVDLFDHSNPLLNALLHCLGQANQFVTLRLGSVLMLLVQTPAWSHLSCNAVSNLRGRSIPRPLNVAAKTVNA
jgi:hypothetical protein